MAATIGESAGNDTCVLISGAAVATVGEPTTAAADLTYQITDAAHQILDPLVPVYVCVKGSNDAAEAGTNTTNLKMTAHGLLTGDVIINTSRSNAKRSVVRVDADNVTVAAVTSQTTGDTIEVYKQTTTDMVLSRLKGMATFGTATSRTVLISGSYVPVTLAAYAHAMAHTKDCALLDSSAFGLGAKKRTAGLLSASGTLSQFDVTDEWYITTLLTGLPVVLEFRTATDDQPDRYFAMLDTVALQAAFDSLQDVTISWISYDKWLKLGV